MTGGGRRDNPVQHRLLETLSKGPPPKERPLGAVCRDFQRRLPDSAEGLPVALVLGERRSGKTSGITASQLRSGAPLNVPSDTWDGAHALARLEQADF